MSGGRRFFKTPLTHIPIINFADAFKTPVYHRAEYPRLKAQGVLFDLNQKLTQQLIDKLTEWSKERWDPDEVANLNGYAGAFLECLLKSYLHSETTQTAMKNIKTTCLTSYIRDHHWTDATEKDLCDNVIKPFWENTVQQTSIKLFSQGYTIQKGACSLSTISEEQKSPTP